MSENERIKEARKAAEQGKALHTDLNIHCRMSDEQSTARHKNFIAGLKLNMFKLEHRARML